VEEIWTNPPLGSISDYCRFLQHRRYLPPPAKKHSEVPSPVLYSLGQMLDVYDSGTFQICNGAGQAQDSVVGRGRQIRPECGLFEKRQAARCQFTIPVQLIYFHVGIAMNSAGITESFPLNFPGLLYPAPNNRGRFAIH